MVRHKASLLILGVAVPLVLAKDEANASNAVQGVNPQVCKEDCVCVQRSSRGQRARTAVCRVCRLGLDNERFSKPIFSSAHM